MSQYLNQYQITFILKGRDEQVITAYGKNQQEALQNAIRSVDLDELEHLTLKNGVFVDEFSEIQEQLTGKYEKNSALLYVGGGVPIVVSNSNIYIDEKRPTKKAVTIERGNFVEYEVPSVGASYTNGGVAWLRFENQHGKGWVLLHPNRPSENYSVYDANIIAVNRFTVEYDEDTQELTRTVFNGEEATA